MTYPIAFRQSRAPSRTGAGLLRWTTSAIGGRVFALPPKRVTDQFGGEVLRRRLRVGVAAREQERVRGRAAPILAQSLRLLLGPVEI